VRLADAILLVAFAGLLAVLFVMLFALSTALVEVFR
jgi:hypothetical protein